MQTLHAKTLADDGQAEDLSVVTITRKGDTYFADGIEVVFTTTVDESAMEKIRGIGFYPVNPDILREQVRKGYEARNLLKALGFEVPTNPGYKQS